MSHLILYGLFAALVCFLVVAVMTRSRRLRTLAVMAGAVALWLPYFALTHALGNPNPFPPTGNFQLLASRIDQANGDWYILIDGYRQAGPPRSFVVPLPDVHERDLPRGSPYDPADVFLSRGAGGAMELLEVDYYPPDPPKGTRNYGQIGAE